MFISNSEVRQKSVKSGDYQSSQMHERQHISYWEEFNFEMCDLENGS